MYYNDMVTAVTCFLLTYNMIV